MKLSAILKKIKVVAKEAFGIDLPKDAKVETTRKSKVCVKQHDSIIIKENKGNVLIKCWGCPKETWVKKGSQCHVKGLCSDCIMDGTPEKNNA
jgi:hypothetical protein